MLNRSKDSLSSVPYVLSLAGMDPSGGAGLLSDIKTMEAHGVHGLGVCTAITAQTEDAFLETQWLSREKIFVQLEPLLERYSISVVKIGIVESLELILEITQCIKKKNPNVFVVWDPIQKPSASNEASFLGVSDSKEDNSLLLSVLHFVDCVTPNKEEASNWLQGGPNVGPVQDWAEISQNTAVYIKSDKADSEVVIDSLWWKGKQYSFSNPQLSFSKHGSGCVFSSALAANVACLQSWRSRDEAFWQEACGRANQYIHEYLKSDPSLLGFHHFAKPVLPSKWNGNFPLLQVLTVDNERRNHIEQAKEACRGGATWIQLRMKEGDQERKRVIAEAVRKICTEYNATLILNDHVKLAKEVGADGVHLGQGDMSVVEARRILGEQAIIGGTANTSEQIQKHLDNGVDYIGVGPYRWTSTKKQLAPVLGKEKVAEYHRSFPEVCFTVIGGIRPQDVVELRSVGVKSVAVSSGVSLAEKPEQAVQEYIKAYSEHKI